MYNNWLIYGSLHYVPAILTPLVLCTFVRRTRVVLLRKILDSCLQADESGSS